MNAQGDIEILSISINIVLLRDYSILIFMDTITMREREEEQRFIEERFKQTQF